MSFTVTRWAWAQSTGRASSKLVLLALADRADDSGLAFPSIATLAANTELDRKTVMPALVHLEGLGLISCVRGVGKGTRYQVNLGALPVPKTGPVQEEVPVPKTGPVQEEVPVPKTGPHQSQKRDRTSPKNGTLTYQEPIKNLRKKNILSSVVENSVTSEVVRQVQDDAPVAPATHALALVPPVAKVATDWPGFDEFWAVYPRKEAKKATRVLWNKLRLPPETIAAILRDVPLRMSQHSAWQDEKFIPHPSSYLNGERWQDSITPKLNGSHHAPRSPSKIDIYSHLDSLSSSELFGYSDRPEERRITGEVL